MQSSLTSSMRFCGERKYWWSLFKWRLEIALLSWSWSNKRKLLGIFFWVVLWKELKINVFFGDGSSARAQWTCICCASSDTVCVAIWWEKGFPNWFFHKVCSVVSFSFSSFSCIHVLFLYLRHRTLSMTHFSYRFHLMVVGCISCIFQLHIAVTLIYVRVTF